MEGRAQLLTPFLLARRLVAHAFAFSLAALAVGVAGETTVSAQDDLEIAKKRVIDARRIVALQERLIADLQAQGQDARVAQQTLRLLVRSLAVFEAGYERLVLEQSQMPPAWTLDTPR